MSFLETPRFPDEIAFWAHGGAAKYNTSVIQVNSGREISNSIWQYSLGTWDFPDILRTVDRNTNGYRLRILRDFFRVMRGRSNRFRFKDFTDFEDDGNGILNTAGVGLGVPACQMYKNYIAGALTEQRIIQKPVSTGLVIKRNGTPVTVGVSAGNIAVDTTTGIVTFVADASSNASSITAGATTTVVLAANPNTLVAGKKLYLSGFTGADAAAYINGIAHTISSVSGSGPYTFILATNTSGKTITLGSGVGKAYPQASDALTWTGEFDVPVRMDSDVMSAGMSDGGLYQWSGLAVVEIRP